MGDKQPVADEVTTPDAMTPDEMDGMLDEIGARAADGALDGEAEHSPEQLHLLLEDARNKADEHWNELLRAQAEHENMRKRAARDVEKARKFALEGFAKDLLPVRDSLEMGLSAAREIEGGHAQVLEGRLICITSWPSAFQWCGPNCGKSLESRSAPLPLITDLEDVQ